MAHMIILISIGLSVELHLHTIQTSLSPQQSNYGTSLSPHPSKQGLVSIHLSPLWLTRITRDLLEVNQILIFVCMSFNLSRKIKAATERAGSITPLPSVLMKVLSNSITVSFSLRVPSQMAPYSVYSTLNKTIRNRVPFGMKLQLTLQCAKYTIIAIRTAATS